MSCPRFDLCWVDRQKRIILACRSISPRWDPSSSSEKSDKSNFRFWRRNLFKQISWANKFNFDSESLPKPVKNFPSDNNFVFKLRAHNASDMSIRLLFDFISQTLFVCSTYAKFFISSLCVVNCRSEWVEEDAELMEFSFEFDEGKVIDLFSFPFLERKALFSLRVSLGLFPICRAWQSRRGEIF